MYAFVSVLQICVWCWREVTLQGVGMVGQHFTPLLGVLIPYQRAREEVMPGLPKQFFFLIFIKIFFSFKDFYLFINFT